MFRRKQKKIRKSEIEEFFYKQVNMMTELKIENIKIREENKELRYENEELEEFKKKIINIINNKEALVNKYDKIEELVCKETSSITIV